MKKLLILFLLVFMFAGANAQTYVRITHDIHYDSLMAYTKYCCDKTLQFYHSAFGIAHGYNQTTDSITAIIDFGDGVQTHLKTNIYNDSVFKIPFNSFTHVYSNIGLVDLKIYAVAPDLQKDSIIKTNYLVGDTCGYITGYFYSDTNSNCQQDSGELLFLYQKVRLWYNNIDITEFSSNNGMPFVYSIYAPKDFDYDVKVASNINGIFCPASIHFDTIPSWGTSNHGAFGYQCDSSGMDLTAHITGWGFVPGSNLAGIGLSAINLGCTPVSNGQLKLVFDNSLLTPTISNQVYTVSGDTIIWNFSNLPGFYQNSAYFYATLFFNVSTQVQLGDTLCFKLIETPFAGDIDTVNNMQYGCWEARSSWDPNDKQVTPQGEGENGYIDKDQNMIYTVRFQNTGNANAANIHIIDTLNNNLEVGTFTVINSSHYMTTDFTGQNVVEFNFPNINLPDSGSNQQGSNGFVTYSIRQKPDLAANTKIRNTAYIYFDYNPAVVTNTTLNTIINTSSLHEIPAGHSFLIYPNPSPGQINIVFSKSARVNGIEVLNSCGQIIMTKKIHSEPTAIIDLTGRSKGLYFIKLNTENGCLVKKFVLE